MHNFRWIVKLQKSWWIKKKKKSGIHTYPLNIHRWNVTEFVKNNQSTLQNNIDYIIIMICYAYLNEMGEQARERKGVSQINTFVCTEQKHCCHSLLALRAWIAHKNAVGSDVLAWHRRFFFVYSVTHGWDRRRRNAARLHAPSTATLTSVVLLKVAIEQHVTPLITVDRISHHKPTAR